MDSAKLYNLLPHLLFQPQKLAHLSSYEHDLTVEVNNFFPAHSFLRVDLDTNDRAAPVSTSINMGQSSTITVM